MYKVHISCVSHGLSMQCYISISSDVDSRGKKLFKCIHNVAVNITMQSSRLIRTFFKLTVLIPHCSIMQNAKINWLLTAVNWNLFEPFLINSKYLPEIDEGVRRVEYESNLCEVSAVHDFGSTIFLSFKFPSFVTLSFFSIVFPLTSNIFDFEWIWNSLILLYDAIALIDRSKLMSTIQFIFIDINCIIYTNKENNQEITFFWSLSSFPPLTVLGQYTHNFLNRMRNKLRMKLNQIYRIEIENYRLEEQPFS